MQQQIQEFTASSFRSTNVCPGQAHSRKQKMEHLLRMEDDSIKHIHVVISANRRTYLQHK